MYYVIFNPGLPARPQTYRLDAERQQPATISASSLLSFAVVLFRHRNNNPQAFTVPQQGGSEKGDPTKQHFTLMLTSLLRHLHMTVFRLPLPLPLCVTHRVAVLLASCLSSTPPWKRASGVAAHPHRYVLVQNAYHGLHFLDICVEIVLYGFVEFEITASILSSVFHQPLNFGPARGGHN